MNTRKIIKGLVILTAFVLSFNAAAFGQQKERDAAARQAQIDADEEQVKIDQLRQNQRAAVGVDDADSPQGLADEEEIKQDERQKFRDEEEDDED